MLQCIVPKLCKRLGDLTFDRFDSSLPAAPVVLFLLLFLERSEITKQEILQNHLTLQHKLSAFWLLFGTSISPSYKCQEQRALKEGGHAGISPPPPGSAGLFLPLTVCCMQKSGNTGFHSSEVHKANQSSSPDTSSHAESIHYFN